MAPTITFHPAKYLARGLYLDITNPESNIPIAEQTSPAVPVIKLDADADCLYWVSMYLGRNIQ